ncbi:DUF1801 domain-containing protein [Yoonia sp.]|uniref:DUF1801 domain-containing protein n=1 Tax=Yoonia sp. TaxID=2212373 RepID=UPI002FDB06D7
MAQNKTQATPASVGDFIAAVDHPTRRADAETLDALFRRVTGWQPQMWGPSIIGYGQYHYVYDSGREGDFLATGFSPRKANISVYILPGYADFHDILARLGKHKIGKSCLYINKLDDVDLTVLADLIRAGLKDLSTRWPLHPT